MSNAWYYVAGFGVMAWIAFGIASQFLGSIGQGLVSSVLDAAGIASGVVAGVYAERTWIGSLVGWVISIHPVVMLVVFVVLLVAAFVTLFAVIPDKWSPGASASLPLAAAWVFIPSALSSGALPGTWGGAITSAAVQASGVLVKATSGAWG